MAAGGAAPAPDAEVSFPGPSTAKHPAPAPAPAPLPEPVPCPCDQVEGLRQKVHKLRGLLLCANQEIERLSAAKRGPR